MDWKTIKQADDETILAWAEMQPWANAMADCAQDARWHAEGDVWTHTKMVCDQLGGIEGWDELDNTDRLALLMTALLHDAAKPLTSIVDPESGQIRSPNHAVKGEHLARSILRDLDCDLRMRESICSLVRYHGRPAFLLQREQPGYEVIRMSAHNHGRLLIQSDGIHTGQVQMKTKQGVPIWQVDAFADRPFTGNPAAVCILDCFPSDQWMQNVAAEMNLAETSFVVPSLDDGNFHLRWFTPAVEVDLCGHATLAAAHALIEQGRTGAASTIRFQTRTGELNCQKQGDRITLDFPATPVIDTIEPPLAREVCDSLGLRSALVMQSKFDIVAIVEDAKTVRKMNPDYNRLSEISTRGVIVTSPSDTDDADFTSRFFAPRCGINEDPVTGSAHCCLAPYWASQLGRTELVGYQASSRGGRVYCAITGDRVNLSGTAITVLEGRLLVSQDSPRSSQSPKSRANP